MLSTLDPVPVIPRPRPHIDQHYCRHFLTSLHILGHLSNALDNANDTDDADTATNANDNNKSIDDDNNNKSIDDDNKEERRLSFRCHAAS
jgi:hypothetical protein